MVTVADLIKEQASRCQCQCELVVSGTMSVRDALDRMNEAGSDYVGIDIEGNDRMILSRRELVDGLLCQLDQADEKLIDLQKQIEEDISVELDLVSENARSIAEIEKNKLDVAIDYMTEGLVIIGNDNEILKCNPSAMKLFGLTGTESVSQFSDALDDYGLRQLLSSSKKDTPDNWDRFKMKSPSGAILQIRWTEMVDECGDLVGNLLMLRDVTDELAGEKAKTEFIAAITHELRTPLTIIQNSVSNILAGVTGRISSKTRKYLETIKGDCRRFGLLVSDLLDVSMLEAGNMPLNRSVLVLSDLITEAMGQLASKAKQMGVELVCDTNGYIAPIFADRQRIRQVLDNLIKNALKFTSSGDKITVRIFQEDGKIVTVVEDTGEGISSVQQKQIFNKFHQVGRQAGAGYKGTGLGLSICNGIIEMHGGSISVESQPGQGSKFYFELPQIDPTMILNKHLETLAKEFTDNQNDVALVITTFEVEGSLKEQYAHVIGTALKELLNSSTNFLTAKSDIAFEMCDNEAVFVVSDASNHRIESVKSEIRKVVKNIPNINWGHLPVVPMIGVGMYVGDSKEIIEIEKIARQKTGKLL